MKNLIKFMMACLPLSVFAPSAGQAFRENSISMGFGYYAQNSFNKTAKNETGETGLLGEASLPVNLKADYKFASDWFFAPQLSYTFIPRSMPGDTGKVTMTHLLFQIGKNFSSQGTATWDWYFGPGVVQYEIKGAGGTTVMNNGTSTATFAIPERNSSVKKITSNLGLSFTYDHARLGFDIIIENLLSGTKRSQNVMLSYAYQFGGF